MYLIDKSVNFSGSSAIVGNIIPVGVGLAYGARQKPGNAWTFICFGDGATEEGVFYESVNFAVLKKLNTVFFCENNLYSVYTDLSDRQPKGRKLYKLAEALGMRSLFLDFAQSLHKTKDFCTELNGLMKQNGPIFVEIETFRHREHCGPNFDDDLEYRPRGQVRDYVENDPLKKLCAGLKLRGDFDGYMEAFVKSVCEEIEFAFDFAERSRSLDYSLLSKMEFAACD